MRETVVVQDTFNRIEEDRMNRLLNCVEFFESTNNPNIIVLDSNKQYSYGLYQFQLSTIRDYYPTSTVAELKRIALSPTSSRLLARRIIEDGKLYKWYNTTKKIEQGQCKNFEPDEVNNYI